MKNKILIKTALQCHSEPKGRRILIVLLCMLFVSCFSACGNQGEKQKEVKPPVIPVKCIKAELKDLSDIIECVGDIKAQDEIIVYPKVSGKVIEKVKEDGSLVVKGDVIVYIDRDEIGLKFEKAPVESPINGIVGRVYVDIGTNVDTQVPVTLLINMDRVKVALNIPEKHISKVVLNQEATVRVDAYPEEFIGKVSKISPVLDLSTRSAPAEIIIDNSGHKLRSGMFARAKLHIEEYKNAVVILKDTVVKRENDSYVYVVEGQKAFVRKIVTGVSDEQYVSIKDGLKAGDLVVVMGQDRLYDGADVTVEAERGVL